MQVCSYELSLFLSFLKDIFTGCGITGSQDFLSAHYRGLFVWLLVCGVEAVWSGAVLGLGLLFQLPSPSSSCSITVSCFLVCVGSDKNSPVSLYSHACNVSFLPECLHHFIFGFYVLNMMCLDVCSWYFSCLGSPGM